VNPPIREPGHQEPLRRALQEGVVDMIATDHAPHTPRKDAEEHLAVRLRFPASKNVMPLMLTG
jgi:dihydroorotase